jgi:hypothetical protein
VSAGEWLPAFRMSMSALIFKGPEVKEGCLTLEDKSAKILRKVKTHSPKDSQMISILDKKRSEICNRPSQVFFVHFVLRL